MGTVSDQLAGVEDPARLALMTRIVEVGRALVPDAEEGTNYGLAALRHRGKAFLAVAETAAGVSLYPFSAGVVAEVVASPVGQGLASTKGAVQLDVAAPPSDAVIEEFVRRRIAEIDGA